MKFFKHVFKVLSFLVVALILSDKSINYALTNGYVEYGAWLLIIICIIIAVKYMGSPFAEVNDEEYEAEEIYEIETEKRKDD